jgi:hypothetical protein
MPLKEVVIMLISEDQKFNQETQVTRNLELLVTSSVQSDFPSLLINRDRPDNSLFMEEPRTNLSMTRFVGMTYLSPSLYF